MRIISYFCGLFEKIMGKIRFWLNNARSLSLPQSMLPALTAIALCYGSEAFSWTAAVVSIAGVAFMHLGLNLLDDWFDYRVGSAEARQSVASEGFRGRIIKYPYLTSGQATHRQLLGAVGVFLALAAACGVVIIILRGWQTLWWIAFALLLGISYSGGPLKLGFRGLGELVIFIMFGPLLMTGVHFAVTGEVGWKIVLLSICVGLLVTNIVYSHSVLDAVPDMKMGKKTMAHLSSSPKGRLAMSAVFNFMPYIIIAAGAAFDLLSPLYLIVFAVLPVCIWLWNSLKDFVTGKDIKPQPKWWMGPMGNFEAYRQHGIDWFMIRWLTARNIVMFFCIIIIAVNLISN